MKKRLAWTIVLLFMVALLFTGYRGKVEVVEVTKEELPTSIQESLFNGKSVKHFRVTHDQSFTYIRYAPTHQQNEYVTTDITVKKRWNSYIVKGTVMNAVNDPYVSYEKMIKINRTAIDNIEFQEQKQ